jgi:hypothetical protein
MSCGSPLRSGGPHARRIRLLPIEPGNQSRPLPDLAPGGPLQLNGLLDGELVASSLNFPRFDQRPTRG